MLRASLHTELAVVQCSPVILWRAGGARSQAHVRGPVHSAGQNVLPAAAEREGAKDCRANTRAGDLVRLLVAAIAGRRCCAFSASSARMNSICMLRPELHSPPCRGLPAMYVDSLHFCCRVSPHLSLHCALSLCTPCIRAVPIPQLYRFLLHRSPFVPYVPSPTVPFCAVPGRRGGRWTRWQP